MNVRAFREEDFKVVRGWKLGRDNYFPPRSHFPKSGYMVEGVSCIFLIETNTAMAFLEFFISNPEASLNDRLKAFDALIVAAEKDAFAKGYDTLTGNTWIPKVMALGLRYDFQTDGKPYYFFRKTLTGENYGRNPNATPNPAALKLAASIPDEDAIIAEINGPPFDSKY